MESRRLKSGCLHVHTASAVTRGEPFLACSSFGSLLSLLGLRRHNYGLSLCLHVISCLCLSVSQVSLSFLLQGHLLMDLGITQNLGWSHAEFPTLIVSVKILFPNKFPWTGTCVCVMEGWARQPRSWPYLVRDTSQPITVHKIITIDQLLVKAYPNLKFIHVSLLERNLSLTQFLAASVQEWESETYRCVEPAHDTLKKPDTRSKPKMWSLVWGYLKTLIANSLCTL